MGTLFAQAPPQAQTQATLRKPSVAAKSGVDAVIQLVTNGMSESLVIKQLQSEGKAYALTTPDLLKLQKAGVSENIINVMMDPKTNISDARQTHHLAIMVRHPRRIRLPAEHPQPLAIAARCGHCRNTAVDTPYPADLTNLPPVRKRRVVVSPFGFGALEARSTPCIPLHGPSCTAALCLPTEM